MGDATCSPGTGANWTKNQEYVNACANSSAINNIRDNFIGQDVDFRSQFEDLKALSQSEITDIENLLGAMTNTNNANMYLQKMSEEEKDLRKKMEEMKSKAEALNVTFNEHKQDNEEIKAKPRVIVLQDYVLAAFAIVFAVTSLVFIFYFTKKSGYSGKTFLLITALFVLLGFFITSIIVRAG
jgi:lipopolysaccharide export LptBFGC system permease protein LptF